MSGGDKEMRSGVGSYFSGVAGEYKDKSERGLWRLVREAEYTAVLRELGSVEGLCVLDAGCGAGWYARRIARLKPRVYAASDALLPMARSARSEGVRAVVADNAALPFKPIFDRIICAGALEFTPDPARFFTEAARALKPGGRLVILAPSMSALARLYRLWHKRHGFVINLFSAEAFREMAGLCGLRLESVRRAALFNLAVRLVKP